MPLHLLKKDEFVSSVERRVVTEQITYVEAVLASCDEFGIAPEGVKALIPQPMREVMEAEFQSLNMMPKEAQLPI